MSGVELHLIVPGSLEQRTGGYIYDRRVVEGLRRRGWTVTVATLEGTYPIPDERARTSLTDALAALPDGALVVIDGLAMGGLPDVVRAERTRLRVLAIVHLLLADETGLEPGQRDLLGRLESQALAACSGIVVTSAFSAQRVRDLGPDPIAIRTVPPGTDPAPAASGPGPDAPPRLLCVASVTPRKGHDVLVRALTRLADASWSCVCAGSLARSPAFADAVQAQVREAGLDDRISFPGECDGAAVDALYASSSVFVLPSLHESYGMVLTEAMARGLPVVSTDAGAIPDTVPVEAGILVPAGDDIALAGALATLLVDTPDAPGRARAERERLGSASRRFARDLPSWDETVDHFGRAVSELAGRSP